MATDAWDKTYDETRRLVFDALRSVDAKQYDDHVWAWLDYLACNANALRDRIANRHR